MVQNHRGLMHFGGRICHFDGVSFVVSCFSAIEFVLRFFDLTLPLYVKQDGGALKLDPQHPPNMTKLDSFVDGVCSPRFGGAQVTLASFKNVKKVNTSSALPLMLSLFARGLK